MPDIKMPTGEIVRFPDDMSQEEIKQKIKGRFPDIDKQESVLGTFSDQALQGATLGFADEIQDFIGSLIASGLDENLTFGEAFGQARELSTLENRRQIEQHPLTAIAGNIVGGVAGGAGFGATKAGKALAESLKVGTTAARVGKSAATGAATAGAFGAGTADGDLAERGKEALKAAPIGAVGGAIAPAVTSFFGRKQVVPNSEELRKQASRLFETARQKGGVLTSKFTDDFLDEVNKLKPQTEIGRLVGGEDEFSKVVDNLSNIRGEKITLEAAQELDEVIGDAIDSFVTPQGKVTKQGKKLIDVQSTLRNMIDDAGEELIEGGKEGFETLKEAKKVWATSRKLADVERIIQRAELMDNPAQGIKSGFRTLLNNPKRLRGFSKAEQEAIKNAAESGVVTDLLRTAGSRLVPIIAGTTSGGLGTTATATAASLASRGAATRVQLGKAKTLADLIAAGGEAVEQVQKVSPNLGISGAATGGTTIENIINR